MTATELFAIVKGVPKSAWPEGVSLVNGNWLPNHIPNELAVLLFEASIMRWLLTKGHVGMKNIGMVRVVVTGVEVEPLAQEYSQVGGIPLEALAAACKEVK